MPTKNAPKQPEETGSSEPTLAQLRANQAKANARFAEILASFPEAKPLPKDDRRRSQGRIGEKEATGMLGVVDAMEAAPAVFVALADKDQGHDPKKLETALMRDRLQRHEVYAELARVAESIARLFSDQALSVGALVAPVVRAGYEIAKTVSQHDPVMRGHLSPMLDYHGDNAAAAVAARKANEAKKTPPKTG